MENSKNKTDNFLKAIKKYADEQRSAMQTEVAQLKEEKLKEATEKGRHDSEKYIKDKLEESRNRQTGILAKKIQEGQKKLFLERAEMTESVFKKAEEKLVEYTKTSDYSNSLVKSAKEVAKLFADNDCVVYVNERDMKNSDKIKAVFAGSTEVVADKSIKIGGIKGVGALIRKKTLAFHPYILGGGQESGRRSGTENVFGIKTFEYAAEKKFASLKAEYGRLTDLREKLYAALDPEIFLRLSSENSSPYILSVAARGCRGEILLHMADDKGLLIGTGSACSSNSKNRYSRVVLACGYDEKTADGVLRLSFSPSTTEEEAIKAAQILNEAAADFRNGKV